MGNTTVPATTEDAPQLPADGWDTIVALASHGAREPTIAKGLGLSWRVWRRLKEQSETVRNALRVGRMIDAEEIACKLREKAVGGNIVAMIAYLKMVHGYRDAGPTEAGEAPVRISITLPAALTPEQYREMVTIDAAPAPEIAP